MKRCYALLLMLLLVFMVGACATGPSVCDNRGGERSYLCEAADSLDVRLEDAGNILMVANAVAIQEGSYTREQAVKVMKDLLSLVERSPSYMYLAKIVWSKVDDYPGLFIVAESYLSAMTRPQIISNYDRDILTVWLQRQIVILGGSRLA